MVRQQHDHTLQIAVGVTNRNSTEYSDYSEEQVAINYMSKDNHHNKDDDTD